MYEHLLLELDVPRVQRLALAVGDRLRLEPGLV
jgi:hypothetical protein